MPINFLAGNKYRCRLIANTQIYVLAETDIIVSWQLIDQDNTPMFSALCTHEQFKRLIHEEDRHLHLANKNYGHDHLANGPHDHDHLENTE